MYTQLFFQTQNLFVHTIRSTYVQLISKWLSYEVNDSSNNNCNDTITIYQNILQESVFGLLVDTPC